MKLTKLKALWLCHELWFWLSENPDKKKEHWPEWEKGGQYIADAECFACEYNNQKYSHEHGCNKCILIEVWGQKINKNDIDAEYCMLAGSPFTYWRRKMDKAKNAKIISDSSYKKYKRIGGKKKKLS